jgi:protein SCO1/2
MLKKPLLLILAILIVAVLVFNHKSKNIVTHSNKTASVVTIEQDNDSVTIGGDFTLTNQFNKPINTADLRGKLLIVFFGFTNCPAICPTALFNISNTFEILPKKAAKQIVPIFITIDPERDNVEVMKEYVASFSPKIIALTGTENDIKKAAASYKIYYRKVGSNPDYYMMDHSGFIYIMSREGKYLTHLPHSATSEEIAKTIDKYLK